MTVQVTYRRLRQVNVWFCAGLPNLEGYGGPGSDEDGIQATNLAFVFSAKWAQCDAALPRRSSHRIERATAGSRLVAPPFAEQLVADLIAQRQRRENLAVVTPGEDAVACQQLESTATRPGPLEVGVDDHIVALERPQTLTDSRSSHFSAPGECPAQLDGRGQREVYITKPAVSAGLVPTGRTHRSACRSES